MDSQRRGEVFWREYCRHADWEFEYERVHSLGDLRYSPGKRTIGEHVVIFNGHGQKKTGWKLSNGECLNEKSELVVHPSNHHKVVIFSACEVGSNQTLCRALKSKLKASNLIAYRAGITDDMAFIAEPMIAHLLFAGHDFGNADTIVDRVRRSLDPLKSVNQLYARSFPLVCY